MATMNSQSPELLDALLAQHGPERTQPFRGLRPHTDLICGLRAKGASFDTVVRVLKAKGTITSDTTVRRFCLEVLGEMPKRAKSRRRPKASQPPVAAVTTLPPAPPADQTRLPSAVTGLTKLSPPKHELPGGRGPRIARVELASEEES
jgi:hypothetical protein